MKKAKKQCFGFFGLALVATMTTIAATMPAPEASATSTISDTLVVRVVGNVPDVTIHNLVNDATYVDYNHELSVNYENVDEATISLTYVNEQTGETVTRTLEDLQGIDYIAGTLNYTILDLAESVYNFGKYTLHVHGIGFDGVYDEDVVVFYYLPVVAEVTTDDVTGEQGVDLEYGDEVDKVVIEIFDEDGNLVDEVVVESPDKRASLPFEDKDLPSGKYTLVVKAYDEDGNELYEPSVLETTYTSTSVPNAGTPDTGGLLRDLNISKEDYLISGLIVFFVLGIVAFGIIARNRKDSSKRK